MKNRYLMQYFIYLDKAIAVIATLVAVGLTVVTYLVHSPSKVL